MELFFLSVFFPLLFTAFTILLQGVENNEISIEALEKEGKIHPWNVFPHRKRKNMKSLYTTSHIKRHVDVFVFPLFRHSSSSFVLRYLKTSAVYRKLPIMLQLVVAW